MGVYGILVVNIVINGKVYIGGIGGGVLFKFIGVGYCVG